MKKPLPRSSELPQPGSGACDRYFMRTLLSIPLVGTALVAVLALATRLFDLAAPAPQGQGPDASERVPVKTTCRSTVCIRYGFDPIAFPVIADKGPFLAQTSRGASFAS
jgi:hypothetical protein